MHLVFKLHSTCGKCIRINDTNTWVLISTRNYCGAIAVIIRTHSVVYNFYPIRRAVCECCSRTAIFRQKSAGARRTYICKFRIFRLILLTTFSKLIEPGIIRARNVAETDICELYVIFMAVEWVRVSLQVCRNRM